MGSPQQISVEVSAAEFAAMCPEPPTQGFWVYRGGHHVAFMKGSKTQFRLSVSIIEPNDRQERVAEGLARVAEILNG